MTRRVAVITDAVSPDFWFPVWRKYYAAAFGAQSLVVVTYQEQAKDFSGVELGAVCELPAQYSDRVRAEVISGLVETLLETHDVVLRCDVDEFLVPDLRRFTCLADYVERLQSPHVTALGVDVFHGLDEPKINLDSPILAEQRHFGVLNSALNKTAITRRPLVWGAGFHGANVAPRFDDLFLFHLKWADLDMRCAWTQSMEAQVAQRSTEAAYFARRLEDMQQERRSMCERPVIADGWGVLDDPLRREPFLASVRTGPGGIQ